MPALERLRGQRVVADPDALDGARWTARPGAVVTVLRLAPDDALAIDAAGVEIDDPHAIVEDEVGFVGAWCAIDDVARHAEWSPPDQRPALAQGAIDGVPAKLWIDDDDHVLVLAAAAYAAVLAERLGWSRR